LSSQTRQTAGYWSGPGYRHSNKQLVRRRVAPDLPPRAAATLIAVTIGVALGLWFLRRPDQLLHPYVWVEEFQILNRYQEHGFLYSVFAPVQGYFVWPTSLTVGSAAALSFLAVPQIDYWLSTAWFVATACLLLLPASSLRLRWRAGLVVLLALAPMNPEVYGIALYIFWWTTLWPLISVIWAKDYWWLRAPVLVIGGMSSLAGAAMVVPYAVLFAITRQRRHLVGTAVLAATGATQAVAYFTSARSQRTPLHPSPVALQELRNSADYVLAWLKPTGSLLLSFTGAFILLAVVGTVTYTFVRRRTPNTTELVAFVVGLIVVGVLSSVPDPLITNPISEGPRYYFLPFVVLSWALLMISVTVEWRWARVAAAALVLVSLLSLSKDFARYDDSANWSAQLARCRTATGPFFVPVQYTGVRSEMWRDALVISPQTCRRLGYH
jgi:hypothetical protein